MKKKLSRMMMGMLFLLLTLTLGVVPVQVVSKVRVKKIFHKITGIPFYTLREMPFLIKS